MIEISSLVRSLAPSATLAVSQKSTEMRAAGIDVINLSVGEPDFDTPRHIGDAAKRAIDEGRTRYTAVAGYLSLRQAICDDIRRTDGVSYAPEQIVVGNGAKQELANVLLALLNPGDEVLIPTPAWVSYVEMVKLARAVPVTIPAGIEADFKVTPVQLEQAITERTRLVMLNSPSNPTGSVYTRAELQALVDVLARHPEIAVLSDEIYQHINFSGSYTSLTQFPELEGRVLMVNGVSKAYAMTGWRIGYVAAPVEVAKAVTKLQSQYTSNPSSIAQCAAEAAYRGPQECVEEMRRVFERRRDLVVSLARQIPGLQVNVPQGAFYLFPNVEAFLGRRAGERVIATSGDLALYLLEEAHVATVDGAAFCAPGYIRLSYATDDDTLREAFKRLAAALAKLQ